VYFVWLELEGIIYCELSNPHHAITSGV
jgi:hypothetical protein